MTHKVTVRFGGAVDSEVHDYSDRVRLLGDGYLRVTRSLQGGPNCRHQGSVCRHAAAP